MLGQSYQLVILVHDAAVRGAQHGLCQAMVGGPDIAADDNTIEGPACLPIGQTIDLLEAAQVECAGALSLLHDAAVHACHSWLHHPAHCHWT